MAGQHARFSPSSAHRIATCPASLRATENLPDEPSWEAVEGTIAHAIHEFALERRQTIDKFEAMVPSSFMITNELRPEEWAVIPPGWGVPREMIDYVLRSVSFCLEYNGEHFVEQRVNISKYTPVDGQFGTCDFATITNDGLLVITDLKYGRGVQVFAYRNVQLVLYALGFIEEHDWIYNFDRVIIRVSQPRLDHYDVWETTADELRAIGNWLRSRFELALLPNPPFAPEEKACQFCKLKPTCPALGQKMHELAQGWFDDLSEKEIVSPVAPDSFPISTPDVYGLTPAQMALVLDYAKLMKQFLSEVETHVVYLLMHDKEVPGWKVVEGRSNRVITDVAGYETHLRNNKVDPFKPAELIGVTEAEKALRGAAKKELSAFLKKPQGSPTLAPASDKRMPYSLTAEQMFSDESDDL